MLTDGDADDDNNNAEKKWQRILLDFRAWAITRKLISLKADEEQKSGKLFRHSPEELSINIIIYFN